MQIFDGFPVEPLPLAGVPERFPNDAPNDARTEVVRIVETIDGRHHVFQRQVGIRNVRKLVAAAVGDGFGVHKALVAQLIVELGARIGVSDRHLNRFDIKFLSEIDRAAELFLSSRRAVR